MKVYDKTVVAIKGAAQRGKSGSAREFAMQVARKYPHDVLVSTMQQGVTDFRLVIRIKKLVVAIETQGDPGTDLAGRLKDVISNYKPDILVCTCRTRGDTLEAVENLKRNYQVIYTSTYSCSRSRYDSASE
ncbi:MAG: hypothetical protein QM734_14405 [Cyclobacteriaceae bacterium]